MSTSRPAWRDEVSGLSLAVFRIGIGTVGALIAVRYLLYGWIGSLLVDPPIHFTYPGLGWIRPWSEPFMSVHVVLMAIAAVLVAVGYRHRVAAAAFAILFAYVELIDRTLYINHYYWIVLTAALLAFLPAANRWSIDARRIGPRGVPRIAVWAARFQVGMVYALAGIAKLNHDWLIRGEPLATWLGARTDIPIVGSAFGITAVAITLAWAGALFDLTVVAWLSWPRTRLYAFATLTAFHVVTWRLFPTIGVFPLAMTVGALIFLAPDWPHALVRILRRRATPPKWTDQNPRPGQNLIRSRAAVAGLSTYVIVMLLIPLRSTMSGDTLWTGDGYQFAWRVMLTEKAGTVDFRIVDPATGARWTVDGPDGLTMRQSSLMATDPALTVQGAHMIEDELHRRGHGDVEVYADAFVSYNGRPHQRFIDPTVDLTRSGDFDLATFVLPLATGR